MSYAKGRNFEYYIKQKLEKDGCFVIRSAGSHGVFDLIAIKNGIAWGIQCKKGGYISKAEKDNIIWTAKLYGIIPCIAIKKDGKAIVINLYTNKRIW